MNYYILLALVILGLFVKYIHYLIREENNAGERRMEQIRKEIKERQEKQGVRK